MWARYLNAAAGLWLMVAPAVLKYPPPGDTLHRIIGPMVVSFAVIAIWEETRPARHVNLLGGIALIVLPWLIGVVDAVALVNSVSTGVLVAACSRVEGDRDRSKFGGGWRSLWPPTRARGEEQRKLYGVD